jgi:hypothetical protein
MVQLYFQALNSYFVAVKTNPHAKPPYKRKNFLPFIEIVCGDPSPLGDWEEADMCTTSRFNSVNI